MSVCTTPDCTCFACSMRAKGVQLAPSATPNRTAARKFVARPMVDPSWEKGIVTEERPDGSRMPILAPGTTRPLGVAEYATQRHTVDEGIRRLHSDPDVFGATAKG